MKNAGSWSRLTGVLLITLTMGCASAYHDYSDCRVNCRYCAPPPLPYAQYGECVCHSNAASEYLSGTAQPVVGHVDSSSDPK